MKLINLLFLEKMKYFSFFKLQLYIKDIHNMNLNLTHFSFLKQNSNKNMYLNQSFALFLFVFFYRFIQIFYLTFMNCIHLSKVFLFIKSWQ